MQFSVEEVVARYDRPYLMFGVLVRYCDDSLEMVAAFNSESQAHEYLSWFERTVTDNQFLESRDQSALGKEH